MKINWKQLAINNTNGITAFVVKMINHPGVINPQHIYQVTKTSGGISLKHPDSVAGEFLNGGIRIPGEITNSFCTLYEIGYFANALLLDAVASSLPISHYREVDNSAALTKKIEEDIKNLSDDQIVQSLQNLKIPIISWLTDDVEVFRFRKEVLYGISEDDSKKIIGKITKNNLLKTRSDEFRDKLWTTKDLEINNLAIKYAKNMCQAKMIQYYLALEKFLSLLNIDIKTIPFYLFCSPYHEVIDLGPDHDFLDLLIELHNPDNLKRFAKLTKQQYPILIKLPCPVCGQSSKKVLQGRIKGDDKKTVRLICAEGAKLFHNEHGIGTKLVKGCGHAWEYKIPADKNELYNLLKNKSFSLHVTLSNCLQLFKNAAITPIAHIFGDLNLYYDEGGRIKIFSPYPEGYGSSAELFTSVMTIQKALLSGYLAPNFINNPRPYGRGIS